MRRRQQPAHVVDGGDPGPGRPAGALKLAAEQSLRGCFWDSSPPSPWAPGRAAHITRLWMFQVASTQT